MRLIGLTGGIGSGKSTVSSMLTARACPVVDADAITRELQAAGQPVHGEIVDRFGPDILHESGELDRAALAEIVFNDPRELAELNAIVHPAVGVEIDRRIRVLAREAPFVVLDVPLLVESGRDDLDLLVVVDVDPELAVQRLVAHREFTEQDARARIANQIARADRLRHADIVIDNNGPIDHLETQVVDLAERLRTGEV